MPFLQEEVQIVSLKDCLKGSKPEYYYELLANFIIQEAILVNPLVNYYLDQVLLDFATPLFFNPKTQFYC